MLDIRISFVKLFLFEFKGSLLLFVGQVKFELQLFLDFFDLEFSLISAFTLIS